MVILLTIRRTAGPGPLTRALFEYTVVFLLAVLVATTGVPLDHPTTANGGPQASAAHDQRPALVKTIDGFRDWLERVADLGPHRDRPPRPVLPRHHPRPRAVPLDQEAAVTLRFADLNPLGRAIIMVVAALTLAVAAIAFATSYGALYAWARDTGLYSDRLTRIWPLLLDGAFIVAQLAAILAGILRGNRAFPILTMLITGALTVWFNLQHAGADPGRRLTAALPPVLMMLAFEIDVQIVRWVMTALGKPIGPITPPPPDGMLAGPVPGAVWRSDALGWNVPPYGSRAGRRAPTGRFQQATTFRKTGRTDNPAWRLGTAVTRPG